MIHLKRVGFILAATAVLATSLACEKEEENKKKDFRDEIVGTYRGDAKLEVEIVAPIPEELPDELKRISQKDSKTIEIIKDPVDPKGIISKDDDYPIEFVSGEEVSNGALFNIKNIKVTERTKEGDLIKVLGGKELYWLLVNGKKTKLYHASFDSDKKSFHFALNVEMEITSDGVTLKYAGTISFEGKK